MEDSLRATLQRALDEGADNAALDTIIGDYARYHLVLAVIGGLMVVGLAALTFWAWRGARRAPSRAGRRWSVERFSLLLLGTGTAVATLLLGVVVAANISTAVAPVSGFEGAVSGVRSTPGTHLSQVQDGYAEWLRAGTADIPADVAGYIDQRLAWQEPKAVVTSLLLLLGIALATWIWRRLVAMSRSAERPTFARSLGLVTGLGAVTATCGVLMLMVLGNTQAAVAPVAMTMFFG